MDGSPMDLGSRFVPSVRMRSTSRGRKPKRGGLMKTSLLKPFFVCLLVTISTVSSAQAPEGIWQGYDGEWKHVSSQLIDLAQAIPEDKFSWRPAAGVRSTSEVFMHIALANFYLLSVTGPKMPAGLTQDSEKKVTSKAEVMSWLKKSLEAVKEAHLAAKPQDLQRKVHIADR